MKPTTVIYDPVDLPEGRKLTLAIQVEPQSEVGYIGKNGTSKTQKVTYINIGYSVKNPTDGLPLDDTLARTIAKGRAEGRTPLFSIVTTGTRVSRRFVDNIAKLAETEFLERLQNYIPLTDHEKKKSKKGQAGNTTQSRETEVVVS